MNTKKKIAEKSGSRPEKWQVNHPNNIIMKDKKVEIRFGKKYLNVQNAGPWEFLIIIAVLAAVVIIYLHTK